MFEGIGWVEAIKRKIGMDRCKRRERAKERS